MGHCKPNVRDIVAALPWMARRTWLMVLILLAAMPPTLAGDSAQVQAKQLAPGLFELTVTLPNTNDPGYGQQALWPVAKELCGAQAALFGKYEFKATAPLAGAKQAASPSMLLVQEVHCGGTSMIDPPKVGFTPAPRTPPTAKDEATIRSRTLDYLVAKDQGDFEAARAMLSSSLVAMMGEDTSLAPRAAFNASVGVPSERQVIRVTWYDDPAEAPGPGRYAAADYSATYPSTAFYCGYVVWLLQPDGSYRIVREEEGQMPPDALSKIKPDQMPDVRRQMGCRD